MNCFQTSKLLILASFFLIGTDIASANDDIDVDVDSSGSTTEIKDDTPTTEQPQQCELDYESFAKAGLDIQSVINLLESENDFSSEDGHIKSCSMDLDEETNMIEMKCDATDLEGTLKWIEKCEDHGGEVIRSLVALLCPEAETPMNTLIKTPICRPKSCEEKAFFVSLSNLLTNKDCEVMIERESDVIAHQEAEAKPYSRM